MGWVIMWHLPALHVQLFSSHNLGEESQVEMLLLLPDPSSTYLQGVMKSVSLWGVSWMMTRVSLEMAMKASSWALLEQSSTTTAQDSAPRSEASGEKRGRTDSFFLGANSAAAGQLYMGEIS